MLLIDGTFVAVFPKLVRALGGDMQAAAVLQSIHYRSPQAGTWTHLSLAEIAEETGLSTDQVHRSTGRLRSAGLLEADGETGAARQWRIDYAAVDDLAAGRERRAATAAEEDSDRETVAKSRRSPAPKRPPRVSTGVAKPRRSKANPSSTTVAKPRHNRRETATPLLIEVLESTPQAPHGTPAVDDPLPSCRRHKRHRSNCADCQTALDAARTPIPPWCGRCDPAGEHDPGQRLVETRSRGRPAVGRCPRCHPSTRRSQP